MTIDEAFPILAKIESVPLAECKAAYDRVDDFVQGELIDKLNTGAPVLGSTRKCLELIWSAYPELITPDKTDFVLATEYAIRRSKN